jgi:transcriptional regulator with XRE-family HTH domain
MDGNDLRRRRLALGLTQAQVADLLMLQGKWRTQSVQRIESGRLGFGTHLQALADRELTRLEHIFRPESLSRERKRRKTPA